MKSEYHFERA